MPLNHHLSDIDGYDLDRSELAHPIGRESIMIDTATIHTPYLPLFATITCTRWNKSHRRSKRAMIYGNYPHISPMSIGDGPMSTSELNSTANLIGLFTDFSASQDVL